VNVSLNWQPIVGGLLLAVGAVVAGVQWWRSRPHAAQTAKPAKGESQKRSADEPAPPGAVQWVNDIIVAMGAAKADSVLAALADGATRDKARMLRIAELEGKPAEPTA
jgi:hypothetical protein